MLKSVSGSIRQPRLRASSLTLATEVLRLVVVREGVVAEEAKDKAIRNRATNKGASIKYVRIEGNRGVMDKLMK